MRSATSDRVSEPVVNVLKHTLVPSPAYSSMGLVKTLYDLASRICLRRNGFLCNLYYCRFKGLHRRVGLLMRVYPQLDSLPSLVLPLQSPTLSSFLLPSIF